MKNNQSSKDTIEVIIFFVIFMIAIEVSFDISERIGGKLGGYIGLLILGLIAFGMIVYAWKEEQAERALRRERRKVREFSRKLNETWSEVWKKEDKTMKVLKLMPTTMRTIELGRTMQDMNEVVRGTCMTVYHARDYIILASTEAYKSGVRKNEIASILAKEPVYGTALVVGVRGEAWCDVLQMTVEHAQRLYKERRKLNVAEINR